MEFEGSLRQSSDPNNRNLLTTWRKQREKCELDGLAPKKRGRKAKPINPLALKVRELESETRRLKKHLDKAETIISFQKNSRRSWGSPWRCCFCL